MAVPIEGNEYLIQVNNGYIKVKATGNFIRYHNKGLFKDSIEDLFEFAGYDGHFHYIADFFPILPIKNFYN